MMITKTSKTAKISLTDNSLTEKMKDVFIALIGCDTAQAGPTRSVEWGREEAPWTLQCLGAPPSPKNKVTRMHCFKQQKFSPDGPHENVFSRSLWLSTFLAPTTMSGQQPIAYPAQSSF